MQTLTGANLYTGTTVISGGTLRIGGGGTTGSLSTSSTITNNAWLAFNRSNTLTQGVDFANNIGGSGNLVQAGSGTTILAGANTYTGQTVVSAGTLEIGPSGLILFSSGVGIGAGTFAVNAATPLSLPIAFTGTGGTIAGTGEITTDLVISSGNTLSPGASPGILTQTGNQTWASGGNYNWQMSDATAAAGTGYDKMVINGALTIGSGFNLNLWSLSGVGPDVNGNAANFDPNAGSHWVIASATSGLVNPANLASSVIHLAARNGTGGFTNALGSGGSFSLVQGGSLGGTTTDDVVLVYYVPEPAAVALAVAGAAVLFAARRRRAA